MTRTRLTPTQENNPAKFFVYRNAAWNTANNLPTRVPFDTKLYDTGSNVDIVTNIGRFTATIPGTYHFNTGILVSGAATRVVIDLGKNGAQLIRFCDTGTVTGAAYQNGDGSDAILAVGDYVEILLYTPASFTGGAGTGPYVTWFSGFLMSGS